ncbi:ABC transporter ATP-binding protein [Rhodobacteraceae bacterium MCCB 386]|nr:ABC transporter ATP-binding protein [Roseitranquillus sediminis]
MAEPLIEVQNLAVDFLSAEGPLRAVDDVSLSVERGRTLGIVGESGSGKSVTSLALMGLLPRRSARVSGSVRLDGRELLDLPETALRDLRGDVISMIFQEPMTSLNPAYRVGDQIAEAVERHRGGNAAAAWTRAVEMLRRVGVPSPELRARDYPHRLSGGMRQRVMIAMALACDPDLLIADEPTTALDVTIQAQILHLMGELQREAGTGIILVSHDLSVIAETCDEVAVMYAGQVVERAPVAAIFEAPEHPYTLGLLGALPARRARAGGARQRLPVIPGTVPQLHEMPRGCRFQGRCPFRIARCAEPPPMEPVGPGRESRCWRTPLEALAA